MPKPQPQDWSQAYANVQRLADRSVLAVLRQALDDVNRMLRQIDPNLARVGDMVRINQLQTVKRNLLNEQGKIFSRMGDIIAERRVQAALQATILGSAIDDAVFGALGQGATAQQLRNALVSGLNQTVDVAVTRMTVSALPLAQKIYLSNVWANGVLQRRINSALLRGLSAQEFAKEARAWFDPRVPGGVRYASMRLARTEINNAFFATSVLQAQEKPWIDSMQWHLSRSHPKPDECDKLAKGGPKGDGVYPKMEVPRKPHPQCFCFVTPVSPDEDEFLDGLVSGKFDAYLRQKNQAVQGRPSAPEPTRVTKAVPKARPAVKPQPPRPQPLAPPPVPPPGVRTPMDVPQAARPYHLHVDGIEDLARTVESDAFPAFQRLTGGVSADTELLTYRDGTKVVRKSAGNPGAEHASSIIGRAIGTRAPRVYRNHPSSVHMDYMSDAKVAAEVKARSTSAEWNDKLTKLSQSDEGLRLGLLDLLIRNGDRNLGNWMLDAGGLIPIDHGHARPVIVGGRPLVQLSASGPFAEQVFIGISKNNKFTPADIDWATARIHAVGPDLVHAGQKDFRDYALAVLEKLRPFAKGTRNILAGD